MTSKPGSLRYAVAAGGLAGLLAIGWGLTLGGGLALGRLDPAFSLPGRILFAAALAYAMHARTPRAARLAGLAMLVASLALDTLIGLMLAGRIAWLQAIVALVVQASAWGAARILLDRTIGGSRGIVYGTIAGAAIIGALGAIWLAPALYAPQVGEPRIRLAIVAGVPLEYSGPIDMTTILDDSAARSPLLPTLTERFAVDRLDAIDASRLERADVLMLAHPRALAPTELVTIDRWVRDGGRVLVFADALLSWPPDYPIGDRRNAPITSLLSPLLDHWGLDLAAPPGDGEDVFMAGKHRVHALSTGRFVATGANCRVALGGRTAECRIGRGRAILVADADLLDPASWSDGGAGAANWRAGNIGWIAALIRDLGASNDRESFDPVWRLPAASRGESEGSDGKSQEQGGNLTAPP